jgi:flagellar protein FlbD
MIQLTRLNNSRLALNCDLIKYVEESPDTVITLLSGEKLVVRESTGEVIERVRDFRRSVLTACEQAIGRDTAAGSVSGGREPDAAECEGPERG